MQNTVISFHDLDVTTQKRQIRARCEFSQSWRNDDDTRKCFVDSKRQRLQILLESRRCSMSLMFLFRPAGQDLRKIQKEGGAS
eukprot:scaffold3337_cov95-Cylindrotheca_fusiformis.AAC.6